MVLITWNYPSSPSLLISPSFPLHIPSSPLPSYPLFPLVETWFISHVNTWRSWFIFRTGTSLGKCPGCSLYHGGNFLPENHARTPSFGELKRPWKPHRQTQKHDRQTQKHDKNSRPYMYLQRRSSTLTSQNTDAQIPTHAQRPCSVHKQTNAQKQNNKNRFPSLQSQHPARRSPPSSRPPLAGRRRRSLVGDLIRGAFSPSRGDTRHSAAPPKGLQAPLRP